MARKLKMLVFFLMAFCMTLVMNGPSYGQTLSSRSCEDCYHDGYDDGYDDAEDDCPCPQGLLFANLRGLYLGLALGYSSFLFNRHLFIDDYPIARVNNYADGWMTRLLAGYGWYFMNYYLALEAFVLANSASGSNVFNIFGFNARDEIAVRNSYGISLLPGYRLFQTLLFLRLGYINTQFKVTDSIVGFTRSQERWVSGFNYGVGMETPLYKRLALRLEVAHTSYDCFTLNSVRATPSDNEGSASLIYHFGF